MGLAFESGDVGRPFLEASNAVLSGFGITQRRGGMGDGRMCAGGGQDPTGMLEAPSRPRWAGKQEGPGGGWDSSWGATK